MNNEFYTRKEVRNPMQMKEIQEITTLENQSILDGYTYKGKSLREWVDIIKEKDGSWIPVEKELPRKPLYDWVLVRFVFTSDGSYGVPTVAEYRNGKWYTRDAGQPLTDIPGIIITDWKPIE